MYDPKPGSCSTWNPVGTMDPRSESSFWHQADQRRRCIDSGRHRMSSTGDGWMVCLGCNERHVEPARG